MDIFITHATTMTTLVSFVVAFGLGWAWYSDALFGKKWREGIGIASDDTSPMGHAMIAQAVGTFLLAVIIDMTAASNDLVMAILIALTISTLVKANGYFSQKSRYAIAVEAGYVIIMVVAMIAVQAVL